MNVFLIHYTSTSFTFIPWDKGKEKKKNSKTLQKPEHFAVHKSIIDENYQRDTSKALTDSQGDGG